MLYGVIIRFHIGFAEEPVLSMDERKESFTNLFLAGSYRFDVQKKICLSTGETIALWSSRDALVLKVLTILIQK